MTLPYYDPNKDEIIGCEKNTFLYLHEEGHQKNWKIGVDPQIQMYSWLIIICAVAFFGWSLDSILLKITFSLPLIGLLYSEFYAWYYAFANYKFNRKTQNGI